MDIAYILPAFIDLVKSVRDVDILIKPFKRISQPGLDAGQQLLAAGGLNRQIPGLITGRRRKKARHIPVGIVQIAADGPESRRGEAGEKK
jgi:hypothetical protein